ncbi:YraN family protein [Kamptonema formosum]|uniref:YraN family protein n=1 Tax=Kamptonema formosum TaxID=331992 RepID=UPI0003465E3A|nr:YraN family protein [Oscillatoria sp. PCC 10802]
MPEERTPPYASESRTPDRGASGEDLVAEWLQQQGWEILHRRWRCRWGEIDIIAHQMPAGGDRQGEATLAFVEVKTRRRGSWDAGGLLAITPKKQEKLCKAAQLFLANRLDLAEIPCRFDVATVSCLEQPPVWIAGTPPGVPPLPVPVRLGEPVFRGQYQLTLQDYIESAFAGG